MGRAMKFASARVLVPSESTGAGQQPRCCVLMLFAEILEHIFNMFKIPSRIATRPAHPPSAQLTALWRQGRVHDIDKLMTCPLLLSRQLRTASWPAYLVSPYL